MSQDHWLLGFNSNVEVRRRPLRDASDPAQYLTREVNLTTLPTIATCGAQGSELVFTYVDQIEFSPNRSRSPHNENVQVVAALGEPYVSGFDPNEIANDLITVGLRLVEDLDGKTMSERDWTRPVEPRRWS